MIANWTKLDDGSWGVRVEGGDFPEHAVGTPCTVRSKSGRKTQIVLGEHVRGFRAKGGRFVDIYEVAQLHGTGA